MKRLTYLVLLAFMASGCMFGSYPSGGPYPPDDSYPDSRVPDSRQPYPRGRYEDPADRPTYSGRSPRSLGRPVTSGVSVTDIRLTDRYTVLYMTYQDRSRPRYDQMGRPYSTGTIAFHPSARLIAANGARTFRFVRAEGIPTDPNRQRTFPGDEVSFVVYFERLDKGLEQFDLYECTNNDQYTCWNVYDLEVDNPLDPVYTPRPQSRETAPRRVETAPVEAPVDAPLLVTGVVRDAKTKRPLSATIDYRLSGSRTSVDSVQSFASTGNYRLSLGRGQVYTYTASARGYLAANGVLDVSRAASGERISRDILLTPLAVGDKVTLENVYFDMSKAELLTASFAELNRVVTMMQDNPNMTIRLEGHTDIIGDHDKNLQLSRDRVNACRRYLVNQGISGDRIQTVGYGDTRPIKTKGTDEERKVNRRVEFVILTL
ncbi:OmpA family protein [Tellurirhabdus rosea]|uniref:OmpA family protein n=1 Tax=Tellurirhabdus rosea TaxID=2674997 RepID=UPI00224F1E79|nr:OmpA family protein [Tellurirhabdus rosea]